MEEEEEEPEEESKRKGEKGPVRQTHSCRRLSYINIWFLVVVIPLTYCLQTCNGLILG